MGAFVWNGHEDEVIFTRFEPDYLYDTGCVTPPGDQLKQYFKLGVKHIFLGYDHIAFLMALLFVRRFADLLKIITAFTVAHTLTLGLDHEDQEFQRPDWIGAEVTHLERYYNVRLAKHPYREWAESERAS